MQGHSGLTFHIDSTESQSRYLLVAIEIEPPFTSKVLELNFPRWVPGSYFIREPIQYMTEVSVIQKNKPLNWKRKGIDSLRINLDMIDEKVVLQYKILGYELSCRSTHVDASHLHMMPPFTFLLPSKGIDQNRLDMKHVISLHCRSDWIPATQYEFIESKKINGLISNNEGTTHKYNANNRDELLDGIVEVNTNENISFTVDNREHILKFWDSGGFYPSEDMISRFIEDMKKIISEHHSLFGVHDWGTYTTVIHLTEKSRGGLEHLNSQTSMMPRNCLIDGHEDEYKDLVSLFSHEYLHQWNVKRLRPSNFISYDLQKEVHTDLLWWFEGCTSWLGDMLCVRSGAWTEKDWRKDFDRKLKRHTSRNGMQYESLAEASHDAWIHLYRSNAFSRERQISYYLEAELAIFCLDSELRKRSKGLHGICDLMVRLCEKFAIGYPNTEKIGVKYSDIRKELVSMKGGRNLGKMLDSLMFERKLPKISNSLKYYGLELVGKTSDDDAPESKAWLGLNLTQKPGGVYVTSHLAASPLRNNLMPGDEIIAINNIRTNNITKLKNITKKMIPDNVKITYNHEGILNDLVINLIPEPVIENKISGKGNTKWIDYISTRQSK